VRHKKTLELDAVSWAGLGVGTAKRNSMYWTTDWGRWYTSIILSFSQHFYAVGILEKRKLKLGEGKNIQFTDVGATRVSTSLSSKHMHSLAPGIGRCSPPFHGDHFLHHFTLFRILSSGCLLLSVYISKFNTHLLQRTPYLTSHSFPLSLISTALVATLLVCSDCCPSILGVYQASFCTACGWLCFLI